MFALHPTSCYPPRVNKQSARLIDRYAQLTDRPLHVIKAAWLSLSPKLRAESRTEMEKALEKALVEAEKWRKWKGPLKRKRDATNR